jgi:8-oxo-dGTP pyrophosphatase MutT (NUDIX family)
MDLLSSPPPTNLASPAPPLVIPAATVVVFRNAAPGASPELLMVQRAKEMRFAGGAAVFPGGRIDPADRELAAELGETADHEHTAARIAGIRETLEETGLAIGIAQQPSAGKAAEARRLLLAEGALAPVLAAMGWQLTPDVLVPFARWCPMHTGSFDTRFYLADLGTGAVNIAVDATENTHLFWASAAEALAMADRGDISVIFPTRRNLERLGQFASYAEARAHAEAIQVRTISPTIIEKDGERWLTIPDDLGYPVTSQNLTSVMRG